MSSAYHVWSGLPPEAICSDFQTLNKLPKEPFEQLCDIALIFISGKQVSSEFMDHLDTFAGQHGLNAGSLKNVVKSLITVPLDAVKKGISASQLREDVIKIGLDEEKADSLVKKWESMYASLASVCQGKSLTINQLVDMEWKFGVTAASSEINKVGSTFLQLKLTINTGNGQYKNVFMELSLPQFYSFLHEMEKAKASLDLVS